MSTHQPSISFSYRWIIAAAATAGGISLFLSISGDTFFNHFKIMYKKLWRFNWIIFNSLHSSRTYYSTFNCITANIQRLKEISSKNKYFCCLFIYFDLRGVCINGIRVIDIEPFPTQYYYLDCSNSWQYSIAVERRANLNGNFLERFELIVYTVHLIVGLLNIVDKYIYAAGAYFQ